MRTIICAAMLALATTTAGAAENPPELSANFLLPSCKAFINARGRWRVGQDPGYCAGMLDLFALASDVLGKEDGWMCFRLPQGATEEQVARVIVHYVEVNPQRMHESFVILAAQALHDAWPCATKRTHE
jgi:hypothetical protein